MNPLTQPFRANPFAYSYLKEINLYIKDISGRCFVVICTCYVMKYHTMLTIIGITSAERCRKYTRLIACMLNDHITLLSA